MAPWKPNVITVLLGMNDAGYTTPFSSRIYGIWEEWYGKLLALLDHAAPAARFTLMRTPPYDDAAHPHTQFAGYNQVLLKFGEHVRELSKAHGYQFVDMNVPVETFVREVLRKQPAAAPQIIPDAIHPGPSGHVVMAATLLKAWNAPTLVSDVRLDAAAKTVAAQQRAEVSNFDGHSWTELDEMLPFPFDDGTGLAAKYTDFNAALNQEMLTVSGLSHGSYRLWVDGQKICEHTSDEWANGVNLADYPSPMRAQAHGVLDLVIKRNELDSMDWFKAGFEFGDFGHARELSAAIQKLEAEVLDKERAAAKPKSHRFQLLKI